MMTKMLARVALQLVNKVPKNLSPLKNWKGFMQHPAGDRLSKVAKNYGDGSLKNLLGDARQFVSNSHIEGKVMSNRNVPFKVLDDMSKPFLSASSKLKSGGIQANKISQKFWDKHWNAERKVREYFDSGSKWDVLAKRVAKSEPTRKKAHSLQGMMDDIGITKHQSKFTRDDPIFDYSWLDKLSGKLTTALRKEDYKSAGALTAMMKGSKPHKDFDIEGLIGQIIRNYKGN